MNESNTAEGESEEEFTNTEEVNGGTENTSSSLKHTVILYIKKCVFLCIGLVIMSFGVGLSIKAMLGTSPISSIPTVLFNITGLSVGTTTIIFNTILVLLQIALLRKRFKPFQLLQIPVCVVFGLLCDVVLSCLSSVAPTQYQAQWLICIAGILLVAIGVSFEVAANLSLLQAKGSRLRSARFCQKSNSDI